MTSPWYLTDYKKALLGRGRVLPAVEQHLLRVTTEKNAKRDTEFLHPSEICKPNWCPKASWYTIKDGKRHEESLSFQRLNIFAEGNAIHDKWQKWIKDVGVLFGRWLCPQCESVWEATSPTECPGCQNTHIRYLEVPIRNEEHHIIGHADGIIDDSKGKSVLELKSIGVGTFRFEAPDLHAAYSRGAITLDGMWKSLKTPFPAHIRQVSLYMHCLGIDNAVVIYEFKATQEVREFEIKLQPHIIEAILKKCKSVKHALDTNTTPMRPGWATSPTVKECSKCPHKSSCWKDTDEQDHQTADTTAGTGTGEVPVEVRLPDQAGSVDSHDPVESRRVIRRRTDEDV